MKEISAPTAMQCRERYHKGVILLSLHLLLKHLQNTHTAHTLTHKLHQKKHKLLPQTSTRLSVLFIVSVCSICSSAMREFLFLAFLSINNKLQVTTTHSGSKEKAIWLPR